MFTLVELIRKKIIVYWYSILFNGETSVSYIHQRNNMVKNQVMPSDVTNKNLLKAMFEIPREKFVPPEQALNAYSEVSIKAKFEREIIESRFLAKMINAFNPKKNELILDIGPAMGYSTAILATMCEAVVMLERAELVQGCDVIFSELGLDNIITSSGSLTEGVPEHAPYEGIFIQLAIDFFPSDLEEQLKQGGKVLAVFNHDGVKQCYSGLKTTEGMSWSYEFDANVAHLREFKTNVGFNF